MPREHVVMLWPGWAYRENGGRATARLVWVLRGPDGAASLTVNTECLPRTDSRHSDKTYPPRGVDASVHRRVTPEERDAEECMLKLGEDCGEGLYDGCTALGDGSTCHVLYTSGCEASSLWAAAIAEGGGEQVIWTKLGELYDKYLGKEDT